MSSLLGKRIVVTRPRDRARELIGWLHALGAMVISLPVIQIEPASDRRGLDHALGQLDRYDWLVLTSAHGVQAVWERARALQRSSSLLAARVACIGPKTAAAHKAFGGQVEFVPEEYIAEAILPGLGDLAGRRILLARADIARADLPLAISAAGGQADDVVAYQTVPAQPDEIALAQIVAGVEMVTFTSASTAHNFVALLNDRGIDASALRGDPAFACIGPVTASAAEACGLTVNVVASEYTTAGLVAAVQAHYEAKDDEDVGFG